MDPTLPAKFTGAATIAAAAIGLVSGIVATLFAFMATRLTARTSQGNSILQARIAQQIKHAEFRQRWIDQLREDMTSFQSEVYLRNRNGADDSKALLYVGRILLRMNPKDDNYANLQRVLSELSVTRDQVDSHDAAAAHADYIKLCQAILKNEWDILKRDLHDISYITS